ncbi:PREDICTED: LOW QUALITY PROTEIN: dihydrolipoyllysine-residue succinyltransferase component of 2-oxoglutarate dehydrogenase complex, mitochondrial-like, partial [Vollenhovia emeryi]|uniref:LOW QUALITY PROTEIN: dihydrolipoyllysine-residue succinyltransferase component of 2-oxoglutarate dehydrogenase complex, mitochondrial-like n=1 Tax=Vollenhovia emeryi TaxID=411798 RepID=UPI0005F3FB01
LQFKKLKQNNSDSSSATGEGDVRWEKKPGDQVKEDDVLCKIETDKTSVPVSSPGSDVVKELFVKDGDTVKPGQKLCSIDIGATGMDAPGATKVPVERAEVKPAPALYAHWISLEIDMSRIMEFRKTHQDSFMKKYGVKLGFMSHFVVASAYALKDQPVVNAMIDGTNIVYRNYVNINVAVATPKGLVLPVLGRVQNKNLAEIEIALAAMGEKARKGKITIKDMNRGTFSISNGGVFGSFQSTPLINPPQSAILGMHGVFDRPIAVKGEVVIRPMMYVALTYDLRLNNGREAVMFLRKIKDAVEDPRVILAGLGTPECQNSILSYRGL